MSVAAVARGRELICATIGKFPLITMRGASPVLPQPVLTTQPEFGRPRYISFTWIVDALLFYGRAFLVKLDQNGQRTTDRPARFMWVPEWSATTDQYGNLTHAYGVELGSTNEAIRIDGPHEGFLNYGADRIREAYAIDRAASHASDNPVPSVELHQTGGDPLGKTEIADMIDSWISARRRNGVGYTNQSVQMIPHGQPAEQLLIDGRNQAALNIARSMGLPAWAVDASVSGSSLTYSNTPSRSRELIDYTLGAYMSAIEGRLGMDDVVAAGQWVRFDTTDLLRGDFAARMDAYAVAIDAGVYTAAECRAMETGTAIEEGSIHA